MVPEFAWDPSGRRLLWTQNKFNDGRRVDQACVTRQLRDAIVGRLQGVTTVNQLPFNIVPDIRDRAADLLRDPTQYPVDGACGGSAPDAEPRLVGETVIGHFE